MKFCNLFILMFCVFALEAQINGNKTIITRDIPLKGIQEIYIGLYAQVEIDAIREEGLTISIDENLLDHVRMDVKDGRLILDQKKWIEPSQKVIIKIGAPNVNHVIQSTHEHTLVTSLDRTSFKAVAQVGTIELEGTVQLLFASCEVGTINATDLFVEEVEVSVLSWGKIFLNDPARISGIVIENGQVIYESGTPQITVNQKSGGQVINKSTQASTTGIEQDIKFINFKIKNNSFRRINAYVRGPKPDGSYFSYGFPMRPGQVRKKNWTIGSKVYRQTNLGTKKLLVEIEAEDEGRIVKLYGNQ